MVGAAKEDIHAKPGSSVDHQTAPEGAINFNMGTLVGSYASVAAMLDELAALEGIAGVLLTFDDFIAGVENFGTRIQPIMKSRAHVKQAEALQ